MIKNKCHLSGLFVEQQFAQLEKQLISCNTKLEVESKRTSELQQELEQTGSYCLPTDITSYFMAK